MFKFKVPIYNSTIVFIECEDILLKAREYKIEFDLDINSCKGLCWRSDKTGDIYIFIKSKHKVWSTISHECLHATNYILESRGVEVTVSNDEAQAYLLGYIIDKIEKYLKI